MHKSTKLTPILRKEVYEKWKSGEYSLRKLAVEYHVDKKVIQRILERGKKGDFSVHDSTNQRYKKDKNKKLHKQEKGRKDK